MSNTLVVTATKQAGRVDHFIVVGDGPSSTDVRKLASKFHGRVERGRRDTVVLFSERDGAKGTAFLEAAKKLGWPVYSTGVDIALTVEYPEDLSYFVREELESQHDAHPFMSGRAVVLLFQGGNNLANVRKFLAEAKRKGIRIKNGPSLSFFDVPIRVATQETPMSQTASAITLQDANQLAANIQGQLSSILKPRSIKDLMERYVKRAGISVKLDDILEDIIYVATRVKVDPRQIMRLVNQHTIPSSGRHATLLTASDYENMLTDGD